METRDLASFWIGLRAPALEVAVGGVWANARDWRCLALRQLTTMGSFIGLRVVTAANPQSSLLLSRVFEISGLFSQENLELGVFAAILNSCVYVCFRMGKEVVNLISKSRRSRLDLLEGAWV